MIIQTNTPIISEKQAKEQGLKTYFTGKPCKHGHISLRITASETCRECACNNIRKARKNNPEKFRNREKKYRQNNPEKRKRFFKSIWTN